MCVIVHLGAKKSISKQLLENCYDNNPEGWGIMYAHEGKLGMHKDVSDFNTFYKKYLEIPREAERAVHFRIRTHGEINQNNCHPFKISEDIGLMHNGFITTHMVDKKMSDTFNYCEYELKPIVAGWPGCMTAKEFEKLVEEATGYSKLIFMNSSGKTLRIRQSMWVERNGVFFSNAHSLTKSYRSNSYSRTTYSPVPTYANTWKTRNSTPVEKYAAMKHLPAVDGEDFEDQQISDLYAGNKTDQQGKEYISTIEEERANAAQEMNTPANTQQHSMEEVDTEVVDDIEDDETDSFTLDMESLLCMTQEDMKDWVQDYPQSATYVICGLMDTLVQSGKFDIDYTTVISTKKKSAVQSG